MDERMSAEITLPGPSLTHELEESSELKALSLKVSADKSAADLPRVNVYAERLLLRIAEVRIADMAGLPTRGVQIGPPAAETWPDCRVAFRRWSEIFAEILISTLSKLRLTSIVVHFPAS